MADMVKVIKTDPALVGKILKSANSSYFGFRSRIQSIERAVPLLGMTAVSALALSFSLAESAVGCGPLLPHFRAYWLQSILQAVAADILKERLKSVESDFFLTGLLLDVGRLAMLRAIPKEYQVALEQAEASQRALHDVEMETLGLNHATAGAKLMESWNLPSELSEATRVHHLPIDEVLAAAEASGSELIKASAFSGAVGDYFCGADKRSAYERLVTLSQDFYDFSRPDLDDFLKRTKSRVETAGEMFSADTTELPEPSELLSIANDQLAAIAMREHDASVQAIARQQAAELEKSKLETKNRDLENRVLHDPLTKIYSRLFFDTAIQQEIDRCSRIAAPLGVVFIDIDNFKAINDAYGHQFGDQVLVEVAEVCAAVLRKADILARYGGEEFVALINEPTESGLRRVGERLRKAVEDRKVYFGSNRLPVTISAGVAMAIPERDTASLDKRLMQAADDAMYESKRNGRNQVHFRTLLDQREQTLLQQVNRRLFSRWLVQCNIVDTAAVTNALVQCRPERERIGILCQQQGYLNLEQVDQIVGEQEHTGRRFGAVAVSLGLLSDNQVAHLLSLQQENATALARQLVAGELLDQLQAAALLEQFRAEVAVDDQGLIGAGKVVSSSSP